MSVDYQFLLISFSLKIALQHHQRYNKFYQHNGLKTYYWTSGSQAEIDFIVRLNEDIVPIEVKAKDNIRSRSLSVYMDRYRPQYAIQVSQKNFGFENGIKSVPLYATFCIR